MRHRTLLDGPQWLTCHPIEDVQETKLSGLRHHVHILSIVLDGEQFRRDRKIIIPQIVMDQLKVPQPLASARVQREQRIPEQVVALAIRAIKIVASGTQREVSDAALLVDGHLIPVVNAAHRFPGIRRPRVVSEFTGMRDHMERPHQLAGEDIVGVNVGGRGIVTVALPAGSGVMIRFSKMRPGLLV